MNSLRQLILELNRKNMEVIILKRLFLSNISTNTIINNYLAKLRISSSTISLIKE